MGTRPALVLHSSRSNMHRSTSCKHSSHKIPLVIITPAKATGRASAGEGRGGEGGAHFLQVPVSKQASLNHEENHPNKAVWQETDCWTTAWRVCPIEPQEDGTGSPLTSNSHCILPRTKRRTPSREAAQNHGGHSSSKRNKTCPDQDTGRPPCWKTLFSVTVCLHS